MQTREWRRTDRRDWPDGPWMAEPDKKQWQDEETGLPCLVLRHPLHGVSYEGLESLGDCHGGLTYSDGCEPSEEDQPSREELFKNLREAVEKLQGHAE